jgi:hypothetical protein
MRVANLAQALCVLVACQRPPPLAVPASTPIEIREACALATHKCSGCHELDRIRDAHHDEPSWRLTVERMRHFPDSAISEYDASVIMKCLVYITAETEPEAGSGSGSPTIAPTSSSPPSPPPKSSPVPAPGPDNDGASSNGSGG